MCIACDAVAIGASELMVQKFNESYLNPAQAVEKIALRARQAMDWVDAARAASTDRTAAIYAARFGITDPNTPSSGRA